MHFHGWNMLKLTVDNYLSGEVLQHKVIKLTANLEGNARRQPKMIKVRRYNS